MKQITAIAAILLASLAAAGSASAQDHAAKAEVPFGFYIDNTWVPAGTYVLTSDARNPELVAIRNLKTGAMLLNVGHSEDRQPGSNVLVFHKIGGQYFLGEIRCAASNMSVGFTPSKREKQARTNEASIAQESTVYLAMK
jgi:hypothetical protein